MWVIYWINTRHEANITITTDEVERDIVALDNIGNHKPPSECCWMVPGTFGADALADALGD